MTDEKPSNIPAKLADDLDENSRDVAVKLVKGLVGIAPYIGTTAAELVSSTIPGLREDRLVDFIRKLADRVYNLEEFAEKMKAPENVDLTEEAMVQASRASTEERRGYIAALLKNSLTHDEIVHDQKKKLFNLLSQLTDHEIIHLKNHSYIHTIGSKHPFVEKHFDILSPVTREQGRSKEDSKRGAFRDGYNVTLTNLGLIQQVAGSTTTTELGNLLLEYIEVPDGTE